VNDHERLHEQLAYYRDLPPAERRTLDAHVAGCAECQAARAAYARQDAVLAALPEVRTRAPWPRPWRARAAPPAQHLLGRLGDGLVLAGVAALLWMLALQVQYLQQVPPAGAGGTPATAITEPGLTIPPTSLQPPSPWLPALPWLGGALLLVGVLFVLSRRNFGLAVGGAVLTGLFLISFVPPLSALPNPAGLYWRVAGGYSYDPHLPFKNQFVIAGQPELMLRPHLDDLLGETGLSPLDPEQPLASYEILRVGVHPSQKDVALVTTRFVYADGSARIFPVPLLEPAGGWNGFWLSGWREDGLERLRSDHLALPGQPFATASAPILLGPAEALALHPMANRLDEVNPGHWLWTSVRVQRLVWAPDGRSFLAAMELDQGQRQLWRVPMDGAPPTLLATGDVREYGWSPDGQVIIYTQRDAGAAAVSPQRPYAVMALAPDGRAAARTLVTGLVSAQLPGLTDAGAWFFSGNALWVAPYDGAQASRVEADLTGLKVAGAPRPAPDGARVVFACGQATCWLAPTVQPEGVTGARVRRVEDVHLAEAAWSADGQQVAVVDSNPNFVSPVRLVVLSGEGEISLSVDIAPREATDRPQWTPDGEAIFVQTYPHDGRRLIAVDLPTRQVLDLSQEHWDAYYALAPDGQSVLLNNGRGGFWLAPILRN
jgi:hypothetical protein